MIQDENESIYIAEQFQNTTEFSIYANIIVNPTRSYFRTFYDISGIQHNLTREVDVGFVNVEANDLHLLPESEGIDFYSAGMDYPPSDIDGDLRVDPIVNAGADE